MIIFCACVDSDHSAYAQNDLNLRMLSKFEGTLSLDAASYLHLQHSCFKS